MFSDWILCEKGISLCYALDFYVAVLHTIPIKIGYTCRMKC